MENIAAFVLLVTWIAGVVLAQGWWKLLAVFFPFYSWYLIIEKIMQTLGIA